MNLIDTILADVGDVKSCKYIRPFELKHLGYKFSKRKSRIRNSTFMLYEVLDEDKSRPASFCFLLSTKTMMGIVLAFPYERYAALIDEEKKTSKTRTKKEKSPDS